MPHPAILRTLVEEYEALVAEGTEEALTGAGGRAQDLAYTLCVSTGTREVAHALEAARRRLAAAYDPMAPPAGTAPRHSMAASERPGAMA